jgi:FkbM family methyltransferase
VSYWLLLLTGVNGKRRHAARWLVYPLLRRLTPAVLAGDGEVQTLVWTGDMNIGRGLYTWRQLDSNQLQEALVSLDRYGEPADMVFVDVGANIGTASLAALASKRFSAAVAIEPDPRALQLLRANAGLNGYIDRMEIVAAAASDVEGEVYIDVNPFNYGDNAVVSEGAGSDHAASVITVRSVRLDRVLPAVAGYDPARAFYWIDVQGHEVPAMRGLGELLAHARAILVEIEPDGWRDTDTGHAMAQILSATHEWFVELGHGDSEPLPVSALSAFCDATASRHGLTNILVFGPISTG